MHETNRRVSCYADYPGVTGQGSAEGICYSYQRKRNANQVITFDLMSALRGGQTHGAGSPAGDPGSPLVPNLVLGKVCRAEHPQGWGLPGVWQPGTIVS